MKLDCMQRTCARAAVLVCQIKGGCIDVAGIRPLLGLLSKAVVAPGSSAHCNHHPAPAAPAITKSAAYLDMSPFTWQGAIGSTKL